MTLDEALEHIAPVVGLTSLMAAPESVSSERAEAPTLESARKTLANLERARDSAPSDASYWGFAGQTSYWQAVVYILEAAEITGPNDLPDVPAPSTENQVVMDSMSMIERYGRSILDAARASH